MPQIAVERLGPGGAQKDGSEDPEPVGVFNQQLIGEPRAEALQHVRMIGDPCEPEPQEHAEPDQHDGAEGEADHLGAEALEEEEQGEDGDHDGERAISHGTLLGR